MIKWMLGFAMVAIVAAVSAFSFGIPAAGTLSLVCLALAALLFMGTLFEKTASA